MNTSKMYILIREDVDLGHALLAAAHGSLSGYLTFVKSELDNGLCLLNGATPTERWVKQSFRKVICRVTSKEFESAKTYGVNMQDMRIMTESGLGNAEVAIVFSPRNEWPKFFKHLKLYRELKDVK